MDYTTGPRSGSGRCQSATARRRSREIERDASYVAKGGPRKAAPGQQQRKVARVRHVHVRVHLGAAVLQKATNAGEGTAYALRIPGSGRVRGGQKRLASTSSILMENEH